MDTSRKTPFRKLIAAAVLVLILAGGAVAAQKLSDDADNYTSGLPLESLSVQTAQGGISFKVEVASKTMDKEMGLMFRKKMGKNHGMLFEMSHNPQPVAFWMKNTLIPLDMLFVAADGKIVNIHHNAHPEDLTPLPSKEPVTAVIEINGGRADELGIKIGDRVVHPWFN